jgi:hypothetical protein
VGAIKRSAVSLACLLVVLCVSRPSTSATASAEVVDTASDILGGGDIAKAVATGQAPELVDDQDQDSSGSQDESLH